MRNSVLKTFNFSKAEINGILVLLITGIFIYWLPSGYKWLFESPKSVEEFHLEYVQILKKKGLEESFDELKSNNTNKSKITELHEFDPNTIDITVWKKFGLSQKQAQTILNYIAKGGRFNKAEDLKKMFVISPEMYNKIYSFIKITSFNKELADRKNTDFEYKGSILELVDINLADEIELEKLKGIGSVFAKRIINYRNKLGGFVDKHQLMEVYGLDSVRYKGLEKQLILTRDIVRIDINTATFEVLINHPYLNYNQVQSILQYRKQHGNFSTMQDLSKVFLLKDSDCEKLAPYLIFLK